MEDTEKDSEVTIDIRKLSEIQRDMYYSLRSLGELTLDLELRLEQNEGEEDEQTAALESLIAKREDEIPALLDELAEQRIYAQSLIAHQEKKLEEAKNKLVRIERAVERYLPQGGHASPFVRIGLQWSVRTEITDIKALPSQYLRTKIESVPDKNKIKQDINDDKEVPGAQLSRHKSLQFK